MLVLTRKIQQQIQIGHNITITILQVKGQSVRVGIEAPRDVRIVRSELTLHDEPESDVDQSAEISVSKPRSEPRRASGSVPSVEGFSSPADGMRGLPRPTVSSGPLAAYRRRASSVPVTSPRISPTARLSPASV